jgi:pimeloyl-ACP methyl ester carboxylesterase
VTATDAPPVALVHGFATSCARTWGETGWIDLLTDVGRSIIGIDLLGHGQADKPHDPAAYDQLEEQVLAQLPPEPVDAIGFSLGARTLLVLASAHPERFHRLIVAGVGANLFRHDESALVLADSLVDGAAPDTPVTQYFRSLAEQPGNDPEALAACLRRPNAPRVTVEGLARITCPVLVVLGDQDFVGPADPLVDALADVRLVTLRGVDHFATPKDFGFIDAGLDFLDAQPG